MIASCHTRVRNPWVCRVGHPALMRITPSALCHPQKAAWGAYGLGILRRIVTEACTCADAPTWIAPTDQCIWKRQLVMQGIPTLLLHSARTLGIGRCQWLPVRLYLCIILPTQPRRSGLFPACQWRYATVLHVGLCHMLYVDPRSICTQTILPVCISGWQTVGWAHYPLFYAMHESLPDTLLIIPAAVLRSLAFAAQSYSASCLMDVWGRCHDSIRRSLGRLFWITAYITSRSAPLGL